MCGSWVNSVAPKQGNNVAVVVYFQMFVSVVMLLSLSWLVNPHKSSFEGNWGSWPVPHNCGYCNYMVCAIF